MVGLDAHPEPQGLLGQLVGVGRGDPDAEEPEVLVRPLEHHASAVEVGGVGVGDDLTGAIAHAPPPAGRGLVLDPDVVTGPEHEGGRAGRARRCADAHALTGVGEAVVAEGWRLGFRSAQVVLDRRRDAHEVVDALDVVGARDPRLLELALEQGDGSLEDPADDVTQALVLEGAPFVAAHGLELRVPELLVRRPWVGAQAFGSGRRHLHSLSFPDGRVTVLSDLVRFVVYGAGAIGGVLGARLAQHGHDVVLIARGPHHEAIKADGLRVQDPDGESTFRLDVVDHPTRLTMREDDKVLLTVKSQHTAGAIEALRPVAPPATPIVCLQNGVENERLALRLFPNVYGVAVMCPTSHLEPGVVLAHSSPLTGILKA